MEENLINEEINEEEITEEEVKEEEIKEEDIKEEKKGGFFRRLVKGLTKTRDSIVGGFEDLFTASEIDEDFYDEIEEILIMSDAGMEASEEIIEELKERVKQRHVKKTDECRELLKEVMTESLMKNPPDYPYEEKRSVILVVGVNGAGKTTTVGKLALKLKDQGKKTMIVAADTFRAAAVEQLNVWADRAGVDFIKCNEGQDPASVVYDAMQAAKARNTDAVICDTAGRLHNKKNLMNELEKITRIINREHPDAYVETLLVLDGATGQNAISQAREFLNASKVTGVVITKLDGTAKGGIAFAIQNSLSIPVKYIGVGEAIDDLQKFDAKDFVDALFDKSTEEEDVNA
ncbi:MAG: signal recognition particle-docking protein FtsY [Lachnospiraceae bacterium]|nr:signal recognition particle-docking protein FtsY [Lachnospiraceae bacterium]